MTLMDDFDLDNMELEEEPQPEESSNRTFLLVAGILGGVLILSLVCIAVYAMVVLPRSREASSTEVAEINAQNTEVAMLSGMTAEAQAWTATPSITPTTAPKTSTPTRTPVLAPTDTPVMDSAAAADVDPRTATVAALFTQQAENALTITPVSTSLPDTGFMDNVGIPGLVALAASLVLVIFLARRLRTGS
ncbi:MAG: hypothetical protein MUO62_00900 [Anaerolineales bacterium]|jgi:hypothetical protein|nr:hypothetical protein [Anaerolineales bacterium]